MKKRLFSGILACSLLLVSLAGCDSDETTSSQLTDESGGSAVTESSEASEASTIVSTGDLSFDNTAWSYNEDDDVYWQAGVVYCSDPETVEYESLGIYVPGAYMDATDNGDGTYTCTVNTTAEVNGYTAETAPIVLPVNTAGYSAQAAPTGYSNGVSTYTQSGFVYVFAGCRGRDNGYDDSGELEYNGGAPWGVTDLKAAIRYIRYNADMIPADTDSVFTFGHSGGGAQSSLMGATGDSELYTPYLESIGAAMTDADGNTLSDAVKGAMCWCPITSLDYANEAYEWSMGQYSSSGTRSADTWTSALSDDLSEAFASYINELGLTDSEGTVLTLEATDDGIYTSGSYYEYLLSEIERSLNNFLSDTEFPYTPSSSEMADGGFPGGEGGGPSGDMSDGEMPGGGEGGPGGDMSDGEMPGGGEGGPGGDISDGEMPGGGEGGGPGGDMSEGEMSGGDFSEGETPNISGEMSGLTEGEMPEGGTPGEASGDTEASAESVTYETAQAYIDSLNSDEIWITYDEATNTASITSVEAFVNHCKSASKNVGAFDDLDRSQAENKVFGDNENDALHFDATMAALLVANQEEYASFEDWDAAYVEAYQEYLSSTDALGNSSEYRQNMYNPMYYLSDYYEGSVSSTVASYWRIHSGIEQGDTALTVEMNLALALEQTEGVEDVDFEMVWGQGHTTAERTGDSTTNFIEWVNECMTA